MVKVGRVVKTTLVNSKRPAWLKKVEVLTRQCSQCETNGQKSTTQGFVELRGRAKYVQGDEPVEQPKVLASKSSFLSDTLMGAIIDLA